MNFYKPQKQPFKAGGKFFYVLKFWAISCVVAGPTILGRLSFNNTLHSGAKK
jgi:hypothetical protein